VRFAFFVVVVQLLATLKESVDTQTKRAEKEHRVSSGLRELNDVKDTLLHAVSHDLKGPLAGIIGAMSTIRRGEELQLTADEVESLYQMIEQSGRKMNRLVDDMLDLERLDRGQIQPEREPTDIGDMACVGSRVRRPAWTRIRFGSTRTRSWPTSTPPRWSGSWRTCW
jgi:K+-sensing histidine kinase KdpD